MKNCTSVIQILACLVLMVGLVGGSHSYENAMVVLAAKKTPTLTPTPAPAPGPAFANLTDLLSVAGPFTNILSLFEGSDLMETLQSQANDRKQGPTLFAPSDLAFSPLSKKTLANLTAEQKKELLLAHCIPRFYTLTNFQNFSNPANTMATGSNGGKYNLNITAMGGAMTVSSGYVTTPIISTVHVTDPVALYTVGKILLPEDIFGLPSPSPAPAPSPVSAPAPAADSLTPKGAASSSSAKTPAGGPSSAHSAASFLGAQQSIYLILAIADGSLLLL
uniref:FAS1 domain-containing protein n=1 Tax=Picea sitchensis TaxID=3332 RepID=D5A936_PICSI|nr:unknown [Picea sitchensis]